MFVCSCVRVRIDLAHMTDIYKSKMIVLLVVFFFPQRADRLESIVRQGIHQVLNTALVGGASLHKKAGGGPHGEAAVGNLLGLEALELGRVALAEAEGVEAEVAGGAIAGLAAGGGGDAGDHLNGGDHDEGEGNVLGVRVPQLPEGVHLALGGGGLAAGGGAEDLDLEDAGDGEHGHTGVLELGLAHPVEIDTDLIDLRKAEGVKANITGHGSVELRTRSQKSTSTANASRCFNSPSIIT